MGWTSVFFRSVERTKLPALIPRRTRRILQTSPTNSRIRILARKSDAGYTLHRETTREHRKPFGSHHTGIYRKNSQRVWRDRLPHPLPARPRSSTDRSVETWKDVQYNATSFEVVTIKFSQVGSSKCEAGSLASYFRQFTVSMYGCAFESDFFHCC